MNRHVAQFFDYVKNNRKTIVTVVVALFVCMILLVFVLFWKSAPEEKERNPFGDINTERASSSKVTNVFDNPGEAFTAKSNSDTSVLHAVTSLPTIGAVVFEKVVAGEAVQYVRYTPHANGHIYEKQLGSGEFAEKISNKTAGAVNVSLWSTNGASTITRYYDTALHSVYTYAGHFTQNGTSSMYRERQLAGTIIDVELSPNGTSVFYLEKTPQGVVGYTQPITGGNRKQVWSSVLQSIDSSWNTEQLIVIYTKPTSVAEGVVWGINPTTGKKNVLLTKQLALEPLVNPVGTKVLFSKQEKENKQFDLGIRTIVSNKVLTVPLSTMAHKCAWGPRGSVYAYCAVPRGDSSGSYLEDWYMGLVHSNDTLWRIDSETGEVMQLVDPHEEKGEVFDIVDLSVSPQEDYLIFRTRNNSILWRYRIPETANATL